MRRDEDAVSAYLVRAVRNEMLTLQDAGRRRQKTVSLGDALPGDDDQLIGSSQPQNHVADVDARLDEEVLLARVAEIEPDPRFRVMFYMWRCRRRDGITVAEIADAFGCNRATVARRMRRIEEYLKSFLE